MLRRGHFRITLALVLLSSTLAVSQEVGRVIGQIRIAKGDFPPHPIMVEQQLRGAAINGSYADNQGRFGFYGLVSNLYHVIVNDEDYYPVDELANLNLLESQFVMVQILLRPREKKTADTAAKQAVGGNPYLVNAGDYNRSFPRKAVKEYEKGLEAEKKGEKDKAIEHYLAALRQRRRTTPPTTTWAPYIWVSRISNRRRNSFGRRCGSTRMKRRLISTWAMYSC